MLGYARGISCSARSRRRTALDGETVDAWLYQRHQLPHRQQQMAHHDVQPQKSRRPEEELGDDEARAVPDGEAVDAKQNASHVCCVPHNDDESRSVDEGRAHRGDDEERS